MLRKADSHVGHVLDYPLEIKRCQRVNIHVGSRVHKIDGVGNAVANGPLDGIHIVPKRADEFQRILYDAKTKLRAEMIVFNMIFALMGIILDRHHFILSQADAAYVLFPFNEFLNDGCTNAKLVILG